MPAYTAKDELEAATGFVEKNDEDGKINQDTYQEYHSARAERMKDMIDNDNFYHNDHYDDAEEAEIEARGQAAIPINVMYSIIKQMNSLLTGDAPTWYVDPVGETDKKYAYLMRQLLEAAWYTSKGGRQLSMAIKDMLITGAGYKTVNPHHDKGFELQVKQIPYGQVLADPMLGEVDYSDADNIIVSKVVSVKKAAKFLNKTEKEVEEYAKTQADALGEDPKIDRYSRVNYSFAPDKTKSVRIIQRHTMEKVTIYVVRAREGNVIDRKIYFKLPEFIKKLKASGEVSVYEEERYVMAKYISIGEYCQRYYMPISRYNIVPFIDEFNGNPYPLGEVDFLYGLQRALNKFVLLAILNATLSNTMKVLAPKGSVNKAEFENSYAIPGALIEYEWTENQPPPNQINPVPLSGEFFAFPRLLIYIMEYVTGIFGVIQGSPEGAPRTASGLMSLQNYGGQKVKLLGRNVGDALSTLGDVGIEMYQNYAPFNQTVQYFKDGEKEPNVVKYNQLKSSEGKIAIENDITIGQFKTRVHLAQNYGSERSSKAQLLSSLAAQTGSPALIKPILQLADIPEADEIASQIDIIANQSKNIEDLQKNLERLEQVNKQLQNQIIQKSQQMDVAQFKAELDKLYTKIEAELGSGVNKEITNVKLEVQRQLSEFQAGIQQAQASTKQT